MGTDSAVFRESRTDGISVGKTRPVPMQGGPGPAVLLDIRCLAQSLARGGYHGYCVSGSCYVDHHYYFWWLPHEMTTSFHPFPFSSVMFLRSFYLPISLFVFSL